MENNAKETVSTVTEDERPRRVIKRYSNRKLYDTKDSRYVTLLQIAEMVRGGEEVQIIDNNTKEDLTEVTLAQIIYEEQKQKASGTSRNVPLQTLKDLIHSRTEKVLSDLREGPIGRLIPGATKEGGSSRSVTEAAEALDAAAKTNGDAAHSQPPPSRPSLVEQAKETFEDWQSKIDERVKAVVPSIMPWQNLEAELKRLNARVADLEAKLAAQDKSQS